MTGNNRSIPKGFVLKARKIEDSQIAHAPPCIREVWDWLLRNVNWRDRKCGETTIRRGQILTSVPKIQEALHWTVGARKERYETHQIERAMKVLRRWGMVATAKAGGGMFITAVNFEAYQNPKNYESRHESRDESRMKAEPQLKNLRTKKKTLSPSGEKRLFGEFVLLTELEYEKLVEKFGKNGADDRIDNLNERLGAKGYKYRSHYHTILTWDRNDLKREGDGSQRSTSRRHPHDDFRSSAGRNRDFTGQRSAVGTTIET